VLRRLAKWFSILAVAGICAATPISIDYTTGAPNANQGASMTYGVLTITARTTMTGTYDPLFGGGSAGTIYWGDLGDLDTQIAARKPVQSALVWVSKRRGLEARRVSPARAEIRMKLCCSLGRGESRQTN